jgi:tRNA A-37 threonylcarbamoyl transferase component Bud32
MDCPSEDVLLDLVEGRLDGDELARLHRHVDSCADCRLVMAALARAHPPSPQPVGPAEGQTISHYRIAEQLGRGGMGVVFAAFDTQLRRRVALKFVASHLAGDAHATARLKREARAASALEHDNVGVIYDVGEHQGALFLAMPLYEGETLRHRLDRDRIPPREAAAILAQIADGLEAAHSAGVIHRDIKPSNIMLLTDGGVRILDFGLAKLAEPEMLLTTSGQVLGTVAYMAPEQHQHAEVDARTDLWALGVTAYEMLSAATPFPGASALEVLHAATTRDPLPLRDRVGADLEAIVFKCLEKERPRRYAAARELAVDLRRWLAGDAISARPIGRAVRLVRQARRHRLALLAVATAAMALVAAAAGAIKLRRDAQLRVERAERLGQATQRIRSQMRNAYLLPLHDTRPDRQAIEAEMRAIRDEMTGSGDSAGGLAEFALGWGELAMGRNREARPHLEAAFRAGQSGPDASWALALDLAFLYVDEVEAAGYLPAGERARRMAVLERELRQPLLEHLGRARGAPQIPVGSVEAMLALAENRHDEAVAKAEDVFQRLPSEYQLGEVAALARHHQALERWAAGDSAGGRALWNAAEETLHRVAAVARSDDHVRMRETALLFDESYYLYVAQAVPGGDEIYRHILLLCDEAAQAAPDSSRPDEARATVLYRQADRELMRGGAPRALLQKVVDITATLLKRDPRSWRGNLSQGAALVDLGDLRLIADEDPRPELDVALMALARARALHEDEEIPTQMGIAYAYRALYLARTGGDPRPDWQQAIAISREALSRDDTSDLRNDLGATLAERATWELEHGIDPSGSIAEGIAELDQAIRLAPTSIGPRTNRAEMLATRARYLAALGGDAGPELNHALELGDKDIALSDQSMHISLALAYRVAAWNAWRHGRDPSGALAHARLRADAAISLEPDNADARLERVKLDLFTAARAHGGRRALDEADADLKRVLLATPHKADARMLEGELHLLEAPRGDSCSAGRAALDDAVARDPRLARAWAVRSRLEKACGGSGQDAHERALLLDRFVDGDY